MLTDSISAKEVRYYEDYWVKLVTQVTLYPAGAALFFHAVGNHPVGMKMG